MPLAGKVVLVTGAGRGIGKAMVLGFAAEGTSVVVVARNAQDTETAAHEARNAGAPEALPLPADVTVESDVQFIGWQIQETFGRLDVLVNHVGGGLHFLSQHDPGLRSWATRSSGPPFWDLPPDWFERIIRLNLMSTFLCSKIMTERFFVPQGSGSIINSSSKQGLVAFPLVGTAPYGTAKAAVNHLTRIMAQELRDRNVAVNAMLIPLVKAGATAGTYWEAIRKQVGGWYRPDVVVPLATYLAQQDGLGTTGQVIDCLEWIEVRGLGPTDKWLLP